MAETTQVLGMGNNGKVQLNGELKEAIKKCLEYRNSVQIIMDRMKDEYAVLQTGFKGKAAQGFGTFYTNVVEGFFQPGGTFDKYMKMYDDDQEGLFASIEKAFIGDNSGIDPNLGDQNMQMAGGTTGTTQNN